MAFVSVTDRDRGEAGRVKTTLEDSEDFLLETVDANENRYMLKTKKPLDRERIDRYSLVIIARDNGNPGLQATETVDIQIGDVNDNAPFFHQSQLGLSPFKKKSDENWSYLFSNWHRRHYCTTNDLSQSATRSDENTPQWLAEAESRAKVTPRSILRYFTASIPL